MHPIFSGRASCSRSRWRASTDSILVVNGQSGHLSSAFIIVVPSLYLGFLRLDFFHRPIQVCRKLSQVIAHPHSLSDHDGGVELRHLCVRNLYLLAQPLVDFGYSVSYQRPNRQPVLFG
jgi:hypothetical protein